MRLSNQILGFVVVLLTLPASAATVEELTSEVLFAETAFAKTMADRDLDAFLAHVADEAIFIDGHNAMRGVDAVKRGWSPYFEGATAPFSWAPAQVDVLESGTLAHSSGPVLDAEGRKVGVFNSVWRREADGTWKVVFDKGCPPCGEGSD